MSTFDSDYLQTTGYFLPEGSQYRLTKLRDYAQFLSHLAEPRTAEEELDWSGPEIRASEVAICLELLAEQMGLVLDDVSSPACRPEREVVPEADAAPEAAEELPGNADGRYLFGVTLDQIDTLHRLIAMISAHGDVVIASDEAEFARHTLSLLGDAIFNDAVTVRDIIRQVESQRLGKARVSQTGVEEAQAVYLAGRKYLPAVSASHAAGSLIESLPGYGERVGCWQPQGPGFGQTREPIPHYH